MYPKNHVVQKKTSNQKANRSLAPIKVGKKNGEHHNQKKNCHILTVLFLPIPAK